MHYPVPTFWRCNAAAGATPEPLVGAKRSPTDSLKRPTASQIDEAITSVYDEASNIGHKPPNVKEIILPVQEKLQAQGYGASGNQIQEAAGAEKHAKRRRPPGKTVKSETGRR
jgi:hypothetical protein